LEPTTEKHGKIASKKPKKETEEKGRKRHRLGTSPFNSGTVLEEKKWVGRTVQMRQGRSYGGALSPYQLMVYAAKEGKRKK